MAKTEILVYCDGGLGNRFNAFLSGLALARHFDLSPKIHWPVNTHCGASIDDLIRTDVLRSAESLSKLKPSTGRYIKLLHDQANAKALNTEFASAYDFESLEDFERRIVARNQSIFFYPAIIPAWIPTQLIINEVNELCFSEHIESTAIEFMRNSINRPYYGIHLRRTDLNVGISDIEVHRLVTLNREKLFFVCSDDPQAEKLASAHPNVRVRRKSSYVVKSDSETAWLTPTLDEDGRIVGNLRRDRDSVIDAAIDLLILGNSSIVGYSGSTFQSMARILGDHYGLLPWKYPPTLNHYSTKEVLSQVKARCLNIGHLIQIAESWTGELREPSVFHTLNSALDHYGGEDRQQLLYALAQIAARNGERVLASLYLRELIRLAPQLADPRRLLSLVEGGMDSESAPVG
jgi:hypothetical protein